MVRLAIPSTIENLLQSFVFLVDAWMLAQVGETELAAVSLTGIFLWRLTEVVGCIQKGSAAFVARRWGEGRHDSARTAVTHGVVLAATLGLLAASAILFLLPAIFSLLGGRGEVINVAVAYTTAVLLAFPFTQMLINLASSFRAAGDTRTPALATILVNILNVILNYILIFGKFGFPALGMLGSGIATGLSLFAGWAFLMSMAARGVRPRSLFLPVATPKLDETEKQIEAGGVSALTHPHLLTPQSPRSPDDAESKAATLSKKSVRILPPKPPLPERFHLTARGLRLYLRDTTSTILRISRPTLVEELIVSVGFLTFFRMIAESGMTALAAHSAVVRIESISYMMGVGFAVAASTMVGQFLGRSDPRNAGRALWLCTAFAMSIMGLLGILFCLFPGVILSRFSEGREFLSIAIPLLIIAAIEQPMLGAATTLSGGLRGAGDTLSPTISQAFGTLGVRVGIGYVLAFPMEMGIQGIYWATVIDWTLRTAILAALIARGRWRRVQV